MARPKPGTLRVSLQGIRRNSGHEELQIECEALLPPIQYVVARKNFPLQVLELVWKRRIRLLAKFFRSAQAISEGHDERAFGHY